MNENFSFETFEKKEEKEKELELLKRASGRCGWATLTFTVTSLFLSLILGLILHFLPDEMSEAFYKKAALYINELIVLLSVGVGMLVLRAIPREKPERRKIGVGRFLIFFCMLSAIGMIGNIIGNITVGIWNAVTHGGVTNPITDVLSMTDPVQIFICTGLLAPILEEFFFRKLLIDRLYRFGEIFAVFTSAGLFALFHQNLNQIPYAFGCGFVLALLYSRTGSYLTVTLLHVLFNNVFGVIPSLMLPLIEKNTDVLEKGELSEIVFLIVPMILYILFVATLDILGVVFLITERRSLIPKKGNGVFSVEKVKKAYLNVGMIVAVSSLTVLTALSLFL